MKYNTFFFLSLFLSIIVHSEEIKYKGDQIKIIFSEEGEIEKIYMEGNVVISYKNIIFKTNKGIFNRKDNLIECKDGVEIISDFGNFQAESIEYNLVEEKGIFYNVRFKVEPFYGKTQKIERDGEFFKLLNGYITTCDIEEKTHYRFQVGKIEYWKGKEYLRCEKVKIIFGDNFNVFYLPFFKFDLKLKKPSFIPSIEYKTRTGPFLGFSFFHRIGTEEDFLMNEKISIGQKGVGVGVGIFSEENKLEVNSFFLKKWDEEILSGIYLEMNKNIGENKIVIDWRWMENNEFFIDFFKEKYLEKSKTFNYFSLTRKLGEGIFGFSLVENAKEEILKVEKLPEIRYFIPYRNIFDTPIFFSYDFRFTNFLKEDDNYLRILNNLNFTYKKDLPYFSIRPYLSFSTLNYENSNFDKFNYIGEFGINFSTNFYKLFNDNNIFFTPSISIFKRNTKYQPNQLIQFDEFENKNEGNFLRSSFLWNIDLKNDSKGSFEIENEYSIDRNKIENIFLKYDLTIKKLKLEGDNEWGLENGENIYKFGVNTISYEDKNYKFSIGTRFEDASNILGLETWWEQSLKNDWQYRIGLFYDFKSDELIYHTYEIWKKIHCLTVSLKVSKDKENFSFYIFVTPSIFFENNWERRFKKWK